MSEALQPMDSHKSFRYVEGKIDKAVRSGELPREQAKKILDSARTNYRNQSYNREISKHKGK